MRCRPRSRRRRPASAGATATRRPGIGRAVGVARLLAVRLDAGLRRARRRARTTALASRGIALRAAPPSKRRDAQARHAAQRAGEDLDRVRRGRARCRRPSARRGRRSPSRAAACRRPAERGAPNVTRVSAPPAQPTVSDASSSLSRLSSTLPRDERRVERRTRRRMPTSSATVISSSSGPCGAARVLGERHHRRDRDAVVRAERGALRAQPAVVADDLDPPGARIVRAVRIALADDVEVTLEDHRRRVLAARRGGDVDDEVAGRVAARLEAVHAGPRDDVGDGRLLLVATRGGSA